MRILTIICFTALLLLLSSCNQLQPPTLGASTALQLPAEIGRAPRLSEGPDGGLTLSWVESTADEATLRFASLSDGQFSAANDVITESRMFVNWADLPGVMHVESDHWIAHWLRYSADLVYSYDVIVSQSFDGGATWSQPLVTHTDGTPTEHGFVSLHRSADGVGLMWLDGRETPDDPMTLRTAVVTQDGERAQEALVDPSVCDCCQTDIAVSAEGPVAVYRDRTEEEVRDIYVTRHVNGEWQPGERIHADNWVIGGCPVNGPSIIANGDDVAVAWFTAADGKTEVKLATSSDSGATFGAPTSIAAGRLAGYVGLAELPDGELAVSWVSRTPDSGNQLNLRLVHADGTLGPVTEIAPIQQLRVFPQLGFQDEALYLFWTDLVEDSSKLRGVRVPVS